MNTKQHPDFKKSLRAKESVIPQFVSKKADDLIAEALFIGIVRPECRLHYLSLAKTSPETFESVKSILKAEKTALVNRYDALMRNGKLFQLEAREYEILYRAKYLTPSRGSITSQQNPIEK